MKPLCPWLKFLEFQAYSMPPSHADFPATFANCPKCHGLLRIDPGWIRQSADCPHCHAGFAITSFHSGGSESVDLLKVPMGRLRASDANTSIEMLGDADTTDSVGLARQPPSSSKQLGRYRLTKLLGSGGFGKVYLAIDPELDRQVAIKLPTFSGVKNASEKFRKEARSVAKLRHPNIVAVFDNGQSNGHVYIVYEYVPGETLEQRMLREPIQERQLIEWIAVLADALSYAAQESIVHRDIKPANIMIDTHGRPQIMDFGLAEALSDGVAATGGGIAGTPRYMSPEQARGDRDIGPASDQHALGVILYEGLTQQRSVTHSGAAAMIEIAERAGPPLEPLASVNSDLQKICLRALAKVPEDRFADAADLADDLRRYLSYHPIQAIRPTVMRRLQLWSKRNPAAAAASLTAAALLILVAVISSTAAVRLTSQRRDLRQALNVAEAAKQRAELHQAESERQKQAAQTQAELARKSELLANSARHEAELATAKAEAALARELEAQAKTKLARQEADEANTQRLAASEQAESARFELESSEHTNRSLRYSEFLVQAQSFILQGDPSAATSTLYQCLESQRGWEWYWLLGRTFTQPKIAQKMERVSTETMQALSIQGMINAYDASEKSNAVIDQADPPFVSRQADLSLAVYLTSDAHSESSKAVFRSLISQRPVDFGLELYEKPAVRLLGPPGIAVSIGGLKKLDEKGQATFPRKYEIWDLGNQAAVRWEGPASYFCPSFAIHSDRQLMFGCTDARTLMTWDLRSNQPLTRTTLDFDVHQGPDAIRFNFEKNLMLLDKEQNIHVVDPATSRFTKRARSHGKENSGEHLTWSDDARYLALSDVSTFNTLLKPEEVKRLSLPECIELVPTGTEDQHAENRQFTIIDTSTSAVVAVIPMPATQFISLNERNRLFMLLERQRTGRVQNFTHPKETQTMCRRILRVDAMDISDSGRQVSFRDSSGGVQSYNIGNTEVGTVFALQLKHPADIVVQTVGVLAAASANSISVVLKTANDGFQAKVLRRLHASDVRSLALSSNGERLASLDQSGVIALWEVREQRLIGKLQVAGATTVCGLDKTGRRFAIGASDGRVIIHDLVDDRVIATIQAHAGAVTALAAVPKFAALVSAGEDRTLKYFDTKSGQPLTEQVRYTTEVVSTIHVATDGSQILVCGGQSVECLQCSESELTKTNASQLSHQALLATPHPDGTRWLVTDHRTVSILDATNGQRLFSMPPFESSVQAMWFVDDQSLTMLDLAGVMWSYRALSQKGN